MRWSEESKSLSLNSVTKINGSNTSQESKSLSLNSVTKINGSNTNCRTFAACVLADDVSGR